MYIAIHQLYTYAKNILFTFVLHLNCNFLDVSMGTKIPVGIIPRAWTRTFHPYGDRDEEPFPDREFLVAICSVKGSVVRICRGYKLGVSQGTD